MSPEQARGKELDARTDLFSFGAVLYEMVTAAGAFRGKVRATFSMPFSIDADRPSFVLNPEVPAELERIIFKAPASRRTGPAVIARVRHQGRPEATEARN